MFVPCIPTTRHTTVINKTIVYSDTVLSLKDLGSNLCVTSINGVSEHELEKCLKIIFESNQDVIFNTIQYSKNDKKVYFYTNRAISTSAYKDSKFREYKPITTKTEILEEVKDVLTTPKNKDKECISLYDVIMLNRKLNADYDNVEKKYNQQINSLIKNRFSSSSSVCIHKFDHKNNLLHISFKRYSGNDYDDIYFTKENGDLYVVKSKSCWTSEVFETLSSTLSKMYDDYMLYGVYKDHDRAKNDINAVNSNFLVDISSYGVDIHVKDPKNKYKNEFKLFAASYTNDFSCECNSNTVIEAIKGNEFEIFKNIFVNISDCPIWMQGLLHIKREEQIKEYEKIENARIEKENRKQKRLELVRKIFPFAQ